MAEREDREWHESIGDSFCFKIIIVHFLKRGRERNRERERENRERNRERERENREMNREREGKCPENGQK